MSDKVEEALERADVTNKYHLMWDHPSVVLAAEVRRLRDVVKQLRDENQTLTQRVDHEDSW